MKDILLTIFHPINITTQLSAIILLACFITALFICPGASIIFGCLFLLTELFYAISINIQLLNCKEKSKPIKIKLESQLKDSTKNIVKVLSDNELNEMIMEENKNKEMEVLKRKEEFITIPLNETKKINKTYNFKRYIKYLLNGAKTVTIESLEVATNLFKEKNNNDANQGINRMAPQ